MDKEKYFEGDDLALHAWESKYRYKDETLDEFFERIAREFARLDNFSRKRESLSDLEYGALSSYGQRRYGPTINRYEKFLELFKDFKYIIPGGSVLAGIGSDKPVSLSNCFVVKTDDSIEDILQTATDMSQIYKRRGGVGVDLSVLRPASAKVNNAARTTSGVVPFMELYSQVTNTIGQDGRRGALMISLDINHPDSPDFVTIKQNLTKVTGANVSVKLNDEFMRAVENDSDYVLRWPCNFDLTHQNFDSFDYNTLVSYSENDGPVVYVKKIKAKELWESIIHCAWNTAEPGILFWDNIINNDPASVYPEYRAISTNPCVTRETALLTKNGFQSIITLVGKEVEIWNGNQWTTVTPFQTSDDEDVYTVTFSDGSSLSCTSYHEFVLSDKTRKQLKDLKIKDKLAKFSYPLLESEGKFNDRDEVFYTQGFFSGDGTSAIEEGRETRYFIDLYGEKIKLFPHLNVKEYGTYDKENDKLRTEFTNPFVKSKTFVPNHLSCSKKNRLEWLAGLIDSDGTLNDSGGSIAITSINKEFLLNVKSLLITLGIRSTIGINKKEQIKEIKGKSFFCQTCYRLVISAFSVKQLSDLGLITYRVPLIANPNRDAARFIQIESIEYIGKADTYCVTDEKDHTALFNHVMTGQCGEIPLSAYDSCRLIATNLYGLVDDPFTENASFNEDLAYKIFYEAQIIGDILVDLELEAVSKIIELTKGLERELWNTIYSIGQRGRRTGVGITGLADMLAALGRIYSDTAFIENLMKIKMEAELDASIDLAIINNPFPAYIQELEYDEGEVGNNIFFENLQKRFGYQYRKMFQWGRRNISWSTIAPTGTISILAGTSSGCEPVFSVYYTRRKKCNPGETPDFVDQNGVGFQNYNVIHGKFKEWFKIVFNLDPKQLEIMAKEDLDILVKSSPWHGNTAEEIFPFERVAVQAMLQKYTTHSISSTVNVHKDTHEDSIALIYTEAHKQGCKGITVYRDGSRSGILVKDDKPILTVRPEEIDCEVKRFKNERKAWVAFVGLLNGEPYEIFTGPEDLDVFPIPSTIEKGKIIKVREDDGTSRYDFRYVDSYGYTNTLGGLSRIFDKEYWNYARFVSALFRQRTPLEQVVKVIDGLSFTNKGMNSWKAGLIRSIKLYIADGTKVHGATCENCGGQNVIYEGGCMICRDCSSSHCG